MYRWNNFKYNDSKHFCKVICMQEHLFKHFNSMRHKVFLINVSITLIHKTDGKNPKKREDYWRRTLKTCFGRDRLWTRNLDTIIHVCSEILFGRRSYRVETSQLICFANQSIGFCMGKFQLRGVSERILVFVT